MPPFRVPIGLIILLAELPAKGPAPGETGECQWLLLSFGISKECWPGCQDTGSSSQTGHWLACDLERVTSLLYLYVPYGDVATFPCLLVLHPDYCYFVAAATIIIASPAVISIPIITPIPLIPDAKGEDNVSCKYST